MKQTETYLSPKVAKKHYCELCDYNTCKITDYKKHLQTIKHKNRENETSVTDMSPKIIKSYTCSKCNILFNSRTTLWRHKKTCSSIDIEVDPSIGGQQYNNTANSNSAIDKELIMTIIQQNHELQNQVMELLKKGTHNTTNNNSHNKTFNLNFFLNETCKNAMNIMDFVNNLQLQLDDLEKMGEIGYVNGMSNIIIKNLKDMDVTERPVHCTDAKREVLYVKDEDKWDKETSDKPKIRKAIKHVAHKNARLLQEFKEKHPDCTKSESKYSDTYTKLMVEAMGGKGSNDDEQESKIIKKVSKEITLSEVNP